MNTDTESAQPRHRTASLIVLAVDIAGLLFLLYCTTVTATKFREIYDELLEGEPLPALTNLVLSIPQPFYAVFFLAALSGLIYKEVRITNKTKAMGWNLAALAVGVLMFMVFVTAMFLPLIALHQSFT